MKQDNPGATNIWRRFVGTLRRQSDIMGAYWIEEAEDWLREVCFGFGFFSDTAVN